MSNTFESINISDIQLDEKNPRFTPVSNQKEAIKDLCKTTQIKKGAYQAKSPFIIDISLYF